MYISSIHIKNFKCIKDAKFDFDPHFNLIIGGNNSGKSTTFEALRLWQLGFNRFLKERTRGGESSFYATHSFSLTLEDISFLRINDFHRLFNDIRNKSALIDVVYTENGISVSLPIVYTVKSEEQTLRVELCDTVEERKNRANAFCDLLQRPYGTSIKNTLLISYINPIFSLPTKEPKFSKGYIFEKLHQAEVENVLRNIIDRYAPRDFSQKATRENEKKARLKQLEADLSSILCTRDKKTNYEFTSDFREEKNSFINIFAENSADKSKVEVSQLGSGTINLLNILAVLAFGENEKLKLNVLLLDEPDSHLHANYQENLFRHLETVSKGTNVQMFIITHNHELISTANNVIYVPALNTRKCAVSAISQEQYAEIVFQNMSTEYYNHLVEEKRIRNELHTLKKAALFCEGSTDVHILKVAFEKIYNLDFEKTLGEQIDFVDCNGASHVGQCLCAVTKPFISIGLFDHDKEGISNYNKINQNHKGKQLEGCSFICNLTRENETNKYTALLPVPSFRSEQTDWYNEQCCIEYMFADDALLQMGVETETPKGFLFKVIKNIDSQKSKIQEGIKKQNANAFSSFRPLFVAIFNILKYTPPHE